MWWSNNTSRNIDIKAGVKMAWTGLNLTNDGRRILNKAQLNNRLNFKSIVIGDGNAPANFNAQKKLVHQLYELTELKISIEDDVCILMTDLPVVDYDYYLREIGVIVTTDDGDKLYAYDNCGGDAQYVINTAGIERTEKRVRLALTVSGVENITVSVPSNLYVDYKDYENTIADIRQSKIDGAGGDISDTVSSVKQTDILENIKSGEKTGQIFGKVSKAINELISHLADNVRHITADERSLWNKVKNKVDIIPGKGLSTNDYTTVEKNKLSGIADKANNYVHPASHPADMITQDATHRFVSDDEKKVWNTNKSNVDTHVSNNTIHITGQERTNWNDANSKKHSHSNKSVLDGITSALINTWNKVTDKLDKTGGTILGDIVPDKTEAYDLGHEDKKWDNVWVETLEAGYVNAKEGIQGNLTGNADTASGIKPIDITGQTIDINTLTLSAGTINNALYVEKTDGGANNIKNIPISGKPFKLYIDLVRWASTTDYITKQTFVSSGSGTASTYERWCANGKWTAWLPNARFTACPTGGQVLIADGASGGIKTSGYTIASSVPANAKFTDTNTTYGVATQSANGLLSAADKKKLDGIAAGANAYSHPTSAGNKHIPSGGSSGQILRWSSDGTAVWGSDNNTTYSNFVKSGTGAKAGLVPAPSTTAGTTKYLREDGTWQVPPDTNNKASAISKTTNGNNIKGTYRCVTLSDGLTKILYGKTTLAQINLKEPYGNAYWADVYIDLPSHINNIENITITPRVPATGLMSVQIMGYTSAYIAIRAFGPKAEAIAYQFMVCVMGY